MIAVVFAALALTMFAGFDFFAASGRLTVETPILQPIFKEKGHAFLTYAPEPKVSPLLNTDSNLYLGARLFAAKRKFVPATLPEVREKGAGTFYQLGNFLWFSLPDNGDANAPGSSEVSIQSKLSLKPWVRYTGYGSLFCLIAALLSGSMLRRSFQSALQQHSILNKAASSITDHVTSFVQTEKWLLTAVVALIGLRAFTLPPLFNFLDTFTMLRAPLSVVGHMAPLYLLLIAAIKNTFGLGHIFMDVLLTVQYLFFGAALMYLGTAFQTTRQKLFAIACVALNFYVPLIVGGIMTESLALSEQIVLFAASIRLISAARIRDLFILVVTCALCVLTRHTFVVFASAIVIYTFMQFVFSSGMRKTKLQTFALSTILCALGTFGGLQLSGLAYKSFGSGTGMPTGHFGVQVMGRGWQETPPADRELIYQKLATRSSDPLIRATFRAVLDLPISTQVAYDYATIYKNIKEIVKRDYSSADYARVCKEDELERATAKATTIFFLNMDPFYLKKVQGFFLEYTQLGETLTPPNPGYEFGAIKSRDFVDAMGVGWNLPRVRWAYLNRCLLNHSAISDMWSHLCEDTQRITEGVFSPNNKNLLRDCINGRLFWLLDFINPATNLVLLSAGIVIGALLGRLSRAGVFFGTAALLSAMAFDLLHAFSTQDTLSRYLAPGSLQLALGSIVVYCELLFGWRLQQNDN